MLVQAVARACADGRSKVGTTNVCFTHHVRT